MFRLVYELMFLISKWRILIINYKDVSRLFLWDKVYFVLLFYHIGMRAKLLCDFLNAFSLIEARISVALCLNLVLTIALAIRPTTARTAMPKEQLDMISHCPTGVYRRNQTVSCYSTIKHVYKYVMLSRLCCFHLVVLCH